ncbi:MAG: hypothetical protein HY718_01140 [Planctomycetes bacterium]|nr:hypothetical protein [Planctomycetota bacterium]
MPKLTLSVDAEVIREAKAIAAQQGTSVSAMFERVIRVMSQQAADGTRIVDAPITRELTRVIAIPAAKDYPELDEDALLDRMDQ